VTETTLVGIDDGSLALRVPIIGVLVNDFTCGARHLEVQGDVASVREVPMLLGYARLSIDLGEGIMGNV